MMSADCWVGKVNGVSVRRAVEEFGVCPSVLYAREDEEFELLQVSAVLLFTESLCGSISKDDVLRCCIF